jgi:tetratricopeptide (TPR) repeat protein
MIRILTPIFALLTLALVGCNPNKVTAPASAFYLHHYPQAREAVRADAHDRHSSDVVLNNMRLANASMADGDYSEAERALLRAYDYLTSGQVNEADRTISSTVLWEGTKVWKGEPFEQAMSFYYVSALYMLKGDWENARAAAANSLFPLRDFKEADMGTIAKEAERSDKTGHGDYFKAGKGYRVIESEFTLGYLMAATSYVLMKQPADAQRMFQHVRELRPELSPLVDTLEQNRYDTLLLVDVGKGPKKTAYGPDYALIKYVPDGRYMPQLRLSLSIDGKVGVTPGVFPVVDLWTLSQHPRWWSLEGMRQAKSTIGSVLLVGGLGAAAVGSQFHSQGGREAVMAGLAAAALGTALKATSVADVRHLETLPRSTFLVPITLGGGVHHVHLHFDGDGGADGTWHDLHAGRPGQPAVYYMRMHNGNGGGMPRFADQPLYSITPEQYRGGPPYIMGGADVTPPSQAILDAYHRAGVLPEVQTVDQLTTLWQQRGGVLFTPGPQGRQDKHADDPSLYLHVVEGGKILWSPPPGSFAYERVTRTPHQPFSPLRK